MLFRSGNDGLTQTAVICQNCRYNCYNSAQHDDALDKIVNGGGHISAKNYVQAGKPCHNSNDYPVGNVKGNMEQAGKTVVQGGGVWNQKDKNMETGS